MSFSGVAGGFQGGDALLAFAAVQQGRMNEQMTEAMRVADLRSQMSGDLADIKAHLETAHRYPEKFPEVQKELQSFLDKYGSEPSLEEVTQTISEIESSVSTKVAQADDQYNQSLRGWGTTHSQWENGGRIGPEPQQPTYVVGNFAEETVKGWMDNITERVDASGTNDQLAMIHIKQLNDNINNSSSMVSGIIESRNNATSSIINNIA